MITLITGAPGTGKSNAFVSLLRELSRDRVVYINGIPDLKTPHMVLDDPTSWPDVVPDGSVIGVDEAQNFFRPRGPGQKVPEHVARLETHRHRGLDFYVITQGPNLIDSNVRSLVGRHVHLRDLGVLGRWWYEWPECADNCRTGWKNAPIKKRYRLDKAAQAMYKSASIHIKPVRSVPWMLAVMVLALIVVGVMSWRTYTAIASKVTPQQAQDVPPAVESAATPAQSASSGPKLIDDRVDWIPRVSTRPESAPAYDEIRKVAVMPRVVGALAMGDRVRCFTQQGTDAGLSDAECRAWLSAPRFDPYAPLETQQSSTSSARANEAESPQEAAPGMTLIEGAELRAPTAAPKRAM